jgi:hypothetical protein
MISKDIRKFDPTLDSSFSPITEARFLEVKGDMWA